MFKYTAIIVGAGSSSRFKKNKLTLKINNDYVINHTIYPFLEDEQCEKIVLVTNNNNYEFLKSLYRLQSKILVVAIDSLTRSESVKFGLNYAQKSQYVLVHDACRPYITNELISRVVDGLKEGYDAVCPIIQVVDSIIDISNLNYLNRENIKRVQTPQGFKTSLLINAFEQYTNLLNSFNDEFSLVLSTNKNIKFSLVLGELTNKKITLPEDVNIIDYDKHK